MTEKKAPEAAGEQAVKIEMIYPESPGIKTFVLAPVTGNALPYKAGQFITFAAQQGEKEQRRSYSFSSSPDTTEPPTITVKRVENGFFSRYLIDEARVGDILPTIGVSGFFTLPEDLRPVKQIFFFAAGVGIVPIISIIKTILVQQPQVHIMLVYSNKDVPSALFYSELFGLVTRHERFELVHLFSNNKNLMKARLSKWMMPEILKKYSKAEAGEMLFYVCGPFGYMRMVIMALEELNISARQIKKENFNTAIPVLKQKPPETDPHTITLIRNGERNQYTCQYPDSILKAARKSGLSLPYSCDTGKCGTCVARLLEGQVWHSYNEVLTDEDLANGLILTCTAFPIGGDVVAEI